MRVVDKQSPGEGQVENRSHPLDFWMACSVFREVFITGIPHGLVLESLAVSLLIKFYLRSLNDHFFNFRAVSRCSLVETLLG